MQRKLEVALAQWLPAVFACSNECDVIDLLTIHRYSVGGSRLLGHEGVFEEINRVVNFLKQQEYFHVKKGSGSPGRWSGIDFENEAYEITPRFYQLKEAADTSKRTAADRMVQHSTHVNIYNINLTFSIEKILELNPSLNLDFKTILKSIGLDL